MANFTPPYSTFTVTNGGTSELLLAGDNARTNFQLQPQTEACLIQTGQTAGTQASGSYSLAANPSNLDALDFNGTAFTFVTGASTSTNIHIEATLAETLAAAVVILNASVTAGVALATYTTDGAHTLVPTYDAGGTDGNSYALGTATGGNVTRSSATLTGGSNTVGGLYLGQYQPLFINCSEYPSFKGDIYILSATNSAKIAYMSSDS